jgi:broad specificity phosphatase PhoE
MLIYMRHGDDHSDGNKHHNDRRLCNEGKRDASKTAKRLIKKYGEPSIVLVSPYQRTYDTIEAMKTRFARSPTIIRDPRLAKYLGPKKRKDADISEALADVLPIDDDKLEFRRRVTQHIEDMELANHHRSDVVVWCITHKIVVKYVGDYFDVRVPKNVDFLDYITIGP